MSRNFPDRGRWADILLSSPKNLPPQFPIDWGWSAETFDTGQRRFEEWLQA